jgi:hypothetical protein
MLRYLDYPIWPPYGGADAKRLSAEVSRPTFLVVRGPLVVETACDGGPPLASGWLAYSGTVSTGTCGTRCQLPRH